MRPKGNTKYFDRHRTVAASIHAGNVTIEALVSDTDLSEYSVRQSVQFMRRSGLVQTASHGFRCVATYALSLPIGVVLESLDAPQAGYEFDSLQSALGVPDAIAETILRGGSARVVNALDLRPYPKKEKLERMS